MTVPVLDNRLDCIVRQTVGIFWVMGESGELPCLRFEAIRTVVFCRYPDETLVVLEQSEYVVV